METTYAQIKNGSPTGIHKNFVSMPTDTDSESWLPVTYGIRNPIYNNLKETISARRTIDNGTVIYDEIVISLPLEQIKINKLEKLSSEYDRGLAAGYPVADKNFTLSMVKDSRNAFMGLFSILKDSIVLGSKQLTDEIVVSDIDQRIHVVTIQEFFEIIVGYGLYYQEYWLRIARASSTIASLTDIDEILNVVL